MSTVALTPGGTDMLRQTASLRGVSVELGRQGPANTRFKQVHQEEDANARQVTQQQDVQQQNQQAEQWHRSYHQRHRPHEGLSQRQKTQQVPSQLPLSQDHFQRAEAEPQREIVRQQQQMAAGQHYFSLEPTTVDQQQQFFQPRFHPSSRPRCKGGQRQQRQQKKLEWCNAEDRQQARPERESTTQRRMSFSSLPQCEACHLQAKKRLRAQDMQHQSLKQQESEALQPAEEQTRQQSQCSLMRWERNAVQEHERTMTSKPVSERCWKHPQERKQWSQTQEAGNAAARLIYVRSRATVRRKLLAGIAAACLLQLLCSPQQLSLLPSTVEQQLQRHNQQQQRKERQLQKQQWRKVVPPEESFWLWQLHGKQQLSEWQFQQLQLNRERRDWCEHQTKRTEVQWLCGNSLSQFLKKIVRYARRSASAFFDCFVIMGASCQEQENKQKPDKEEQRQQQTAVRQETKTAPNLRLPQGELKQHARPLRGIFERLQEHLKNLQQQAREGSGANVLASFMNSSRPLTPPTKRKKPSSETTSNNGSNSTISTCSTVGRSPCRSGEREKEDHVENETQRNSTERGTPNGNGRLAAPVSNSGKEVMASTDKVRQPPARRNKKSGGDSVQASTPQKKGIAAEGAAPNTSKEAETGKKAGAAKPQKAVAAAKGSAVATSQRVDVAAKYANAGEAGAVPVSKVAHGAPQTREPAVTRGADATLRKRQKGKRDAGGEHGGSALEEKRRKWPSSAWRGIEFLEDRKAQTPPAAKEEKQEKEEISRESEATDTEKSSQKDTANGVANRSPAADTSADISRLLIDDLMKPQPEQQDVKTQLQAFSSGEFKENSWGRRAPKPMYAEKTTAPRETLPQESESTGARDGAKDRGWTRPRGSQRSDSTSLRGITGRAWQLRHILQRDIAHYSELPSHRLHSLATVVKDQGKQLMLLLKNVQVLRRAIRVGNKRLQEVHELVRSSALHQAASYTDRLSTLTDRLDDAVADIPLAMMEEMHKTVMGFKEEFESVLLRRKYESNLKQVELQAGGNNLRLRELGATLEGVQERVRQWMRTLRLLTGQLNKAAHAVQSEAILQYRKEASTAILQKKRAFALFLSTPTVDIRYGQFLVRQTLSDLTASTTSLIDASAWLLRDSRHPFPAQTLIRNLLQSLTDLPPPSKLEPVFVLISPSMSETRIDRVRLHIIPAVSSFRVALKLLRQVNLAHAFVLLTVQQLLVQCHVVTFDSSGRLQSIQSQMLEAQLENSQRATVARAEEYGYALRRFLFPSSADDVLSLKTLKAEERNVKVLIAYLGERPVARAGRRGLFEPRSIDFAKKAGKSAISYLPLMNTSVPEMKQMVRQIQEELRYFATLERSCGNPIISAHLTPAIQQLLGLGPPRSGHARIIKDYNTAVVTAFSQLETPPLPLSSFFRSSAVLLQVEMGRSRFGRREYVIPSTLSLTHALGLLLSYPVAGEVKAKICTKVVRDSRFSTLRGKRGSASVHLVSGVYAPYARAGKPSSSSCVRSPEAGALANQVHIADFSDPLQTRTSIVATVTDRIVKKVLPQHFSQHPDNLEGLIIYVQLMHT